MALVTQTEIRDNCINNANFNTALIKDETIKIAELLHVKSVLGDIFYYDVALNSGNYSNLLDGVDYVNDAGYILHFEGLKKVICYYALYEALPYVFTQLTNQGLMINDTEFSNNVSTKERASFRSTILTQANMLRDELMDYIHSEINTYTLYSYINDGLESVTLIGGLVLES